MTNITIANNKIEGRKSKAVRVRMHDINLQNGDKQPTDVVFDVAPGEEQRINLNGDGAGFEVRPLVAGAAFASDEKVTPDVFGKHDAYERLKAAVLRVPTIRSDMTLSDSERDAKAAAAWNEALTLARQ